MSTNNTKSVRAVSRTSTTQNKPETDQFFQAGIYSYDGPARHHLLSGYHRGQGIPQNVSIKPHSGSLAEIANVAGRKGIIEWETNAGAGDILFDVLVGPVDNTPTANYEFLAKAFDQSRGDFVYTFDPVCTSFHQGAMYVCFVPSVDGTVPDLPTYQQALGLDGVTLVLHNTTQQDVRVPFQFFHPWLKSTSCMGRLVGYVFTPLVATTAVEQEAEINFWHRMENAQFKFPKAKEGFQWQYLNENGDFVIKDFGTGEVIEPPEEEEEDKPKLLPPQMNKVKISADLVKEQSGNEVDDEFLEENVHSTERESGLDETLGEHEDNLYKVLKRGYRTTLDRQIGLVNKPSDYLQHFKNFFFAHSGSRTLTFHGQEYDSEYAITGDSTQLTSRNTGLGYPNMLYGPRVLANGIGGPFSVTVPRQTTYPLSIGDKLDTPYTQVLAEGGAPNITLNVYDSLYDDFRFYMLKPLRPQTITQRTPRSEESCEQKPVKASEMTGTLMKRHIPAKEVVEQSANDPSEQSEAPGNQLSTSGESSSKVVKFRKALSLTTRNIPITCPPVTETSYPIIAIDYNAVQPVGQKIAAINLRNAIEESTFAISGIYNYQNLSRYDTKVTFKINSTAFHQGRLIAIYNPHGPNVTYSDAVPTLNNAINTMIRVDGEEQTFEMDIPFFAPGYDTPRGTVDIYVLNQLRGPTDLKIMMYFSHSNVEMAVRRVPRRQYARHIDADLVQEHEKDPKTCNFVTKVKEWLDRNPRWSVNYNFNHNGEDHNPLWKCVGILAECEEKRKISSGVGCTKGSAKQAASADLWYYIESLDVPDTERQPQNPRRPPKLWSHCFAQRVDPEGVEEHAREQVFRPKTLAYTPKYENGFDCWSVPQRTLPVPQLCGWSIQSLLLSGDIEENPGPMGDAPAAQAEETSPTLDPDTDSAASDPELPSFIKQVFKFLRKLTSGIGSAIGTVVSYITDTASQFGDACIDKITEWGFDKLTKPFQKKFAKYWESAFKLFKYTIIAAFLAKKVLAIVKGASYLDVALDLIVLSFVPEISTKVSEAVHAFTNAFVKEESKYPVDADYKQEPWIGALITIVVTIAGSLFGMSLVNAHGLGIMLSFTFIRPAITDAYKLIKRGFEAVVEWVMGPSEETKPAQAQLEELGESITTTMNTYYRYRADGALTTMNTSETDKESVDMLAFMVRARALTERIRELISITKTQRELWKFIKDVDDTWQLILRSKLATIPRMEPIGIMLRGDSGCGKSVLSTTTIPEHIMLKLKLVETRKQASEQIYCMPTDPDHKYYDGYIGQLFSVYDDFGSQADGSDYTQFLQLISTASAPLNMASIEDKGIMFCSPFVVATTNQPTFSSKAIHNKNAMKRRFILDYNVALQPAYIKKGRLDYDKLTAELQKCVTIQDEMDLYNHVWRFERRNQNNVVASINYCDLIYFAAQEYTEKSQTLLKNRSKRFELLNNIETIDTVEKITHTISTKSVAERLNTTLGNQVSEDKSYASAVSDGMPSLESSDDEQEEDEAQPTKEELQKMMRKDPEVPTPDPGHQTRHQQIPATLVVKQGGGKNTYELTEEEIKEARAAKDRIYQECVAAEKAKLEALRAKWKAQDEAQNKKKPEEKEDDTFFDCDEHDIKIRYCNICKQKVDLATGMTADNVAHFCFSGGKPYLCPDCREVGGCSHIAFCTTCNNYPLEDGFCRCVSWNQKTEFQFGTDNVLGCPILIEKPKSFSEIWKRYDNPTMTPEEKRRHALFTKAFGKIPDMLDDHDACQVARWSQAYIAHIHHGIETVREELFKGKQYRNKIEEDYIAECYRAVNHVVAHWKGDLVSMARYVKACVSTLGQEGMTDDYGIQIVKYVKNNTMTAEQIATLAVAHFWMSQTVWWDHKTGDRYYGPYRHYNDFFQFPTPLYNKLGNFGSNRGDTICGSQSKLNIWHRQFHYAYRYRRSSYCFLDHFDFLYRWAYDHNYYIMDSNLGTGFLKLLLMLGIRFLGFYIVYKAIKLLISYVFGLCVSEQSNYSSDQRKHAPRAVKKIDGKFVMQQGGVQDSVFEHNAKNAIKIWASKTKVENPMAFLDEQPSVFGMAIDCYHILTVHHVMKHNYLYVGLPTEKGCIPTLFDRPAYMRLALDDEGELQDAVLLRSPCSIWKARNLIKQFYSREAYHSTLAGAHKAAVFQASPLGLENKIAVFKGYYTFNAELNVTTLAASLTAEWESHGGWCGLPYTMDGHYIGIHTGQHLILKDLFMAPVCRESIEDAKNALEFVCGINQHVEVDPIHVQEEMTIKDWESDKFGFEVLGGCVDRWEREMRIYSKYDTEFVPSLINSEIWPDDHLPSAKNRRILIREAQKYGFKHPHNPPSVVDSQFPLTYWEHIMAKRPDRSQRLLSDDEILNGNDVIAPLMRDTSAGFWSIISQNGKKEFIDVHYDEETGKRIQTWSDAYYNKIHPYYDRSLANLILEIEHSGRQGIRSSKPMLWVTTCKDELRKTAKVEAEKTRVFEAASLDLTYLIKKYFGAFGEFYRSNAGVVLGHAIGLDRVANWSALYTMLTKGGKIKFGIDLDYAAFDSTIPPAFYTYFEQLIELYYRGAPPEEHRMRAVLIHEMQHSYQYINGCIVLSHKGNKSGMWLTDVLNSVANQWALMICFHRIHSQAFGIPPTVMDWVDNVSLFTYGDDVVMGVSDNTLSWYNAANIGVVLFDLGFRATAGDKSELTNRLKLISELTFLKSAFVLRDGIVACPMPMETSYRELNWVRKKHKHNYAVLVGMWNDALTFASWHNEEEFLKLKSQLVEAIYNEESLPDSLVQQLHTYRVLHANTYVKQTELKEAVNRGSVLPVVYRTLRNF